MAGEGLPHPYFVAASPLLRLGLSSSKSISASKPVNFNLTFKLLKVGCASGPAPVWSLSL